MDPLPPIPRPAAHIWRQLRVEVLPLVFFLCVVAAIYGLWRTYIQPVTIVGQVETNVTTVISIQDGTLAELHVDRLDRVCRDQVIGKVTVADPDLTRASLEVIAADLRLMQARMGLDKIRNLDSYTRLRLDLLNEQTALALAQVRLPQAEAELRRAKELFDKGLIPAGVGLGQSAVLGVEVAQRDVDALRAEITNRTEIIERLEQEIRASEAAGATNSLARDPAVEEAIKAQQEQLALQTKPLHLKAPIDGIVSQVLKLPGEKVIRGTPVVAITPPTARRIIGHLRQPITRIPTTNDTVRIRSRGAPRQMAEAPIVKVGTQLEPINPLLLSPDGTRMEVGLPILVNIPAGMTLRPGEFVDLTIHYSSAK